jgi:hypothetical protein
MAIFLATLTYLVINHAIGDMYVADLRSGFESIDQGDVCLHRIVLGHPFQGKPGIILGTPDEIESAWAFAAGVANRCLGG